MDFVIPEPRRPFVPVRGTDAVFPVRRIYCIGFNYASHNVEMGRPAGVKPVFFTKPGDTVVWADSRRGNPVASIPYPSATRNCHYEVELVAAIGKSGRHVSAETALDLVYGYAVGLDLTRRDLQNAAKEAGNPWDIAKGFDHSAPIGDIVPVREVSLGDDVRIGLTQNGETRQDGRIGQMIVKVPDIIAALSVYFELAAGDLVFTGTPEGVGPIAPGDRLEAAIDGIGALQIDIGDRGA